MKIAVIGATGRTGREVVKLAHGRGDEVVAVVRNPAGLNSSTFATVRVADATHAEELVPALAGVDAVVSCVGPVSGQSRTVQHDAIMATLAAMNATGVRRLVAVSASGWVVDGDDPVTRYLAKPILRRFLRDINADFAAMEQAIRAGSVQWTIVRPPRLVDKAPKGEYRSRRDGNVRWGFQITRADLAAAVLDDIADPGSIGQIISVAN